MPLRSETPAFAPNQRIPDQFSRDGGNRSPRVEWRGAPHDTRSFALIVEDPDAPRGTFRHWAAYDIAPEVHTLIEGAGSPDAHQGANIHMAANDFGNTRYDGPQPPPGHGVHRYHFRLFALDVGQLDLPDDASAKQVLNAAIDHAIDEADVVGTFSRS
jgi:Raf kinase inhibitor-like YbhB/YbcL family protein